MLWYSIYQMAKWYKVVTLSSVDGWWLVVIEDICCLENRIDFGFPPPYFQLELRNIDNKASVLCRVLLSINKYYYITWYSSWTGSYSGYRNCAMLNLNLLQIINFWQESWIIKVYQLLSFSLSPIMCIDHGASCR